MEIRTISNKISVSGLLTHRDIKPLLAAFHRMVQQLGYHDLTLDLSGCTGAYGSGVLPIAAKVRRYRIAKIDTEIVLPTDPKIQRLFKNTNWAHLLDPLHYPESIYHGSRQMPAVQFRTADEQFAAVNGLMEQTLRSVELDRDQFKALEWAINELTDNVINHAESPIGGLAQLTITHNRTPKRLEFVVADAGIGIPTSLRSTHSKITSDVEALDQAIRQGVTRDKKIGQGNGLFGSWQIAQYSAGSFDVYSGYAAIHSAEESFHIQEQRVPYGGAVVVCTLNVSEKFSIEQALNFEGKPHVPLDIVDTQIEPTSSEQLIFSMKAEAKHGFGSRVAGAPLRIQLKNLATYLGTRRIIIDFSDIPLISSSFADEVFGKLFTEMGPIAFMQTFEFANLDGTVRGLIDRAIQQRMNVGAN